MSISNIGFTAGNIAGLKGIKLNDKLTLVVLLTTSVITGLFVPYILAHINISFYEIVLGIFLVLLAPILYKKPFGLVEHSVTPKTRLVGYGLIILLTIMARFTLGVGALFSLVLCRFCGLTVLEANLTRKVSGLISGLVVAVGVSLAGFVNWPVTVGLCISSVLGAYIGARLTVKKGDAWTSKALTITMFISGLVLIAMSLNNVLK